MFKCNYAKILQDTKQMLLMTDKVEKKSDKEFVS